MADVSVGATRGIDAVANGKRGAGKMPALPRFKRAGA
jgi:hypothetical protein